MTFVLFTIRLHLRPYTFVWENVEKSFSQNVFRTNDCNLQCMIKVVKVFSYNQNFVTWGLSALAPGIYESTKLCNLKSSSSETHLPILTRSHMGPSVEVVLIICSNELGLHAHIW